MHLPTKTAHTSTLRAHILTFLYARAVYLSASIILKRRYDSAPFQELKTRHPTSMTNYWPYLRQREELDRSTQPAIAQSWVEKVIGSSNPIGDYLKGVSGDKHKLNIMSR